MTDRRPLLFVCFLNPFLCFFGKDYIAAKDALLILMIGQGICSAFERFRFI
jgi:hypothetical protein